VTREPSDRRIQTVQQLYERAMFGGEGSVLPTADRELDAVEADLLLARGQIAHVRFLDDRTAEDPRELTCFERAAELYRSLGDERGESAALFWIGCFHQVVRDDTETALPSFERSYALATKVGDPLTQSYALRHLAFADHAAGRLERAREQLEESSRLRRALEFWPGVAANLVGLAHIALDEARRADAIALLDEAASLAEASGANRIASFVEEARARATDLD
jgi:tetratricopeptide (TPR) repeat protein